ncbi:MAG TPA: signal recognition particle protein [Candidatus Methylomirabilis sp.]|nr:signal recognition particle protein [Candidatus Methylomirabilis sp.]
MFDGLAERLGLVFKRLRGHGRLTEENINEGLREVRLALLEADVNFRVVKGFIERIRERSVGREVLESLTPGQQVVKVVYEELVGVLGGTRVPLAYTQEPPTVLMLVGLHGSGKTTTAGKLARWLLSEGRSPLLVAADQTRPAAREQLQILGNSLGIPVFVGTGSALQVCQEARGVAKERGHNALILDTSGRLHVDEPLMQELVAIKHAMCPAEVLMVADAMTGQDAVNSALRFDADLGLTGFVLTKLDGDARGGAALSIRSVTGKPIKFVGVGEKLDALEPFHPDRMASRILGMGDILTLVEKAQATVDQKRAAEVTQKIASVGFTLEDFRLQLRQLKELGPLEQVMGMIPGLSQHKGLADGGAAEQEFRQAEAIMNSMTRKERESPGIISGSRRRRIAAGSGTSVAEVNRLLKQFSQAQRLMRQLLPRDGSGAGRKMAKRLLPFLAG